VIGKDLYLLYNLHKDDILGFDLKKSPCAYPVLQKSTEIKQRSLIHQTPFKNLFIAGRTGMFQYRMLEGCYESAITCVEAITADIEGKSPALEKLRIKTDAYGRPMVIPE
jgi:hypothetical protein